MLRIILGIIVGIVAAWAASFILFTILWIVLDAETVFEPGTFDISMSWLGFGQVVTLLSGAAGGLTAGKIGRWPKMPIVFSILVLVLAVPGVVMAATTAGDPPTPREGEVTMADAMGNSRQPVWSALVTSAVFAAAAFAGARMTSPKKAGA